MNTKTLITINMFFSAISALGVILLVTGIVGNTLGLIISGGIIWGLSVITSSRFGYLLFKRAPETNNVFIFRFMGLAGMLIGGACAMNFFIGLSLLIDADRFS